MTLASALLVVLAALFHATWNLLAKRAAPVGPIFVFCYNIVALVVYGPWVIWLIASGAVHWTWPAVLAVGGSGLIHLAYALSLQTGYRVADLSVVYPVARGTGPLLSSIGAFVLLGEVPRAGGVIGLICVVAGIWLIATDGRAEALRRPQGRAGLRWGLTTGGLIAIYTVADGYSVKALGVAPVILDWFSTALRTCLLAPLYLRNPRAAHGAMRGYWRYALGVGILSPLSYILVLGAMQMGAPLSLVAPMREMSMMVGALMGMMILRERVGRARLIGCGVLIAGVIALGSA